MSKINTHASDLQMNETRGPKLGLMPRLKLGDLLVEGSYSDHCLESLTPPSDPHLPTVVNHLDDLIVNDIFKREVSLFVPFMMKTDSVLYGLFKLGGKIMPRFETVLVWAKLNSFKMSDD